MVQFLSINFFSWISSIFVWFLKVPLFVLPCTLSYIWVVIWFVKISEKGTAVITRTVITCGYVDCPVFGRDTRFRPFVKGWAYTCSRLSGRTHSSVSVIIYS